MKARGRFYYYHRQTRTRLLAPFGSAEFLVELERLNKGNKTNLETLPGTLGGLIDAYKESPEFLTLAGRTQFDYQRIFDYLKPALTTPIEDIDTPSIVAARDRALKKHKRRFANYVVQVFSILFKWGVPRGITKSDVAKAVPRIKRPHGARKVNRAWSLDEAVEVLNAAPQELKVPIALGLYAGLSQGDVLRLPRNAYDGDRITWDRGKTGVPIRMAVHAELKMILDTVAADAPLLVTNRWGRQYTGSGFRASFFKLIRRLTDADRVAPGLTFHGLRHTLGKAVIEAGGDTRDVMAMLSHRTEAMSHKYSDEADRTLRSDEAVRRLERHFVKHRAKNSKTMVPRGGFEPPTRGFSVRCSTN